MAKHHHATVGPLGPRTEELGVLGLVVVKTLQRTVSHQGKVEEMRRRSAVLIGLALILVACGSDAGSSDTDAVGEGDVTNDSDVVATGDAASSNGDVVNRQLPGQAMASVDGLEFRLTEPGGLECNITPTAITLSFRIGDNEVVLGAGASLLDQGWFGDVLLTVANPQGERGPITYSTKLAEDSGGLAIDGDSMSYAGPMWKQPANDGSFPPQVEVGEGTISATCP